MPAPISPFVPEGPGWPTPAAVYPGYHQPGMQGMGDALTMQQVQPAPGPGGAGPWIEMNEVRAGQPLNLHAQMWEPPVPGYSGMGYMPAQPALVPYGYGGMGLFGALPQTIFGIPLKTWLWLGLAAGAYWFLIKPRWIDKRR